MMVLGSHVLDMMRYFLGDPKWVVSHITSKGEEIDRRHVTEATEPIGPIAGSQVGAIVAFADGVHGYFASRASSATDPLRFGTWIYGSKGVLFLPNAIYPAGGLYLLRSAGWLPDDRTRWERVEAKADLSGLGIASTAGKEIANALMVADLLGAVEHDRKPSCNEEDGRWTVEMIQGTYQAQLTGGRVSFPLSPRVHPLQRERAGG
jgi:predicted dehydrogenase